MFQAKVWEPLEEKRGKSHVHLHLLPGNQGMGLNASGPSTPTLKSQPACLPALPPSRKGSS